MMKTSLLLLLALSATAFAQVMVGGYKDLSLEDENLYEMLSGLARFSLEEIGKKRAELSSDNSDSSKFNYSLIQVTKAQSQVVSGVNYFLTIRMKQANCKRGCTTETCELVIYEKPWQNIKELTDSKCVENKPKKVSKTNRPPLLGAPQEISTDNVDALKALDFAVESINQQSNNLYYQKMTSAKKFTRQVVSGFKYVLVFDLGNTDCTKQSGKPSNLSLCNIDQNAATTTCTVDVWDQPWMTPRYKIVKQSCNKN